MTQHQYQLFRPKNPMDVFVYRNLHNGMWSVRSTAGYNYGRVIFHAVYVRVSFGYPKVSEAGRQRVLKEKRKNVHAGIDGRMVYLVSTHEPRYTPSDWNVEPWDGSFLLSTDGNMDPSKEITYNPYKGPHFVFKESGVRADLKLHSFRLFADGKVEAFN